MTALPAGVVDVPVALVSDGDYLPSLLGLIEQARARIDCSLFMIDLSPGPGGVLAADDVLQALARAAWRGVRVRLLLGGSRENLDILQACTAAWLRARALGLDTRLLASQRRRGSHVKLVIADDRVLTGSQNWSHGAFFTQTQDALLLDSADLAAQLGALFAAQWARAARAARPAPGAVG
ncbi:MAG: phospholipase D family protein [Rubrivivax sp.]